MEGDLRLRFDSSPGHSAFILLYNQQVITIQPENQTLRSVPLWVGRSVREPPQDGANEKRPDLSHCAALAMRSICEFHLRLHTTGGLNSGGIRGKQRHPWVPTAGSWRSPSFSACARSWCDAPRPRVYTPTMTCSAYSTGREGCSRFLSTDRYLDQSCRRMC